MEELEIGGEVRKLGTLVPTEPDTRTYTVFESVVQPMSDDEIKRIVTDPARSLGRKRFGDEWITDQKSHGSCNGFATANALSRARYLRGIRDKLILSGSYIYSWINGGADNGSLLRDGMATVMSKGAPTLERCPWNMIYRNQTQQFDAEAAKRKGIEAYAAGTLQGFKTGLALGYMGVCAVHVGSRFMNLEAGGVNPVSSGPGNHAEAVDDLVWDGGRFKYDIPGSWGLGVMDRGRSYHVDEHFEQTFGNHQFWLLRSTEEAE